MENDFRVEVRKLGDATVLVVSGELDLVSGPELEHALHQVESSEPGSVILDLRAVEFMDSAGLSVVVNAHQRSQSAGTEFGLVNGSRQVQRLLALTGMDARIATARVPEELLGGD